MPITYKHHGLQPFRIEVRLDGKRVGDIKRDESGYFYRVKGQSFTGAHYSTVEAVRASLEDE